MASRQVAAVLAVTLVMVLPLITLAGADMLEDALVPVWEDKGWFGQGYDAVFHGGGGQPARALLEEGSLLPAAVYAATHAEKQVVADTAAKELFDVSMAQEEEAGGMRPGLRARCRHTRGRWCGRYDMQREVPAKPAPRGSTPCRANDKGDVCNGVGNCNYDLGLCDCPAGWTGVGCLTPDKRPCMKDDREGGSAVRSSHIDKDGRDLGWDIPGWRASRCAGICDDELAMCWCDGTNEKLRHIRAPEGSPPGTPPRQLGRPLSEYCGKVEQTKDGKKTSWGNVPYDKVYGPTGWCEADVPDEKGMCDYCQVDNLDGPLCDKIKEAYCPNQCTGHGDCNLGFCKCHTGWYGTDCSRKAAGAEVEASDLDNGRKPWLKRPSAVPAEAREVPALPTRKRPLIYVYDVPPPYTTRMLQYRLVRKACVWRHFTEYNTSETADWLYGVETYFHEMLLQSAHRTFDPEDADYFFVPLYVTCFFWPIMGWADHPWWGPPGGDIRPMHGAGMMLELKRWLEATMPYWKRRGGRDHIWLTAADEGACWMPKEIYDTSVILTHWGRLDVDHKSNTAFNRDNYDREYPGSGENGSDWRDSVRGHACYDPKKDLVIPSLKLPQHYSKSPLLGNAPYHRDILLAFKGDVGTRRAPQYSRGIRQKLAKLSKGGWREQHAIWIMDGGEPFIGGYSELLSRSVFCLVAPGDGWSARLEDAVLHGCLPLIIMDNVHTVFETILDFDAFSVRVKESSIEDIPVILKAIPQDQVKRMQLKLSKVWHRFAYASGTLLQAQVNETIGRNLNEVSDLEARGKVPRDYPLQRVRSFTFQDDAFGTIMQWLYAKIPDTRGDASAAAR